ncbi:Uncharacterised protein [uncultured archaeon]|nr:Uncharacterised protein [uncultured archaeon]
MVFHAYDMSRSRAETALHKTMVREIRAKRLEMKGGNGEILLVLPFMKHLVSQLNWDGKAEDAGKTGSRKNVARQIAAELKGMGKDAQGAGSQALCDAAQIELELVRIALSNMRLLSQCAGGEQKTLFGMFMDAARRVGGHSQNCAHKPLPAEIGEMLQNVLQNGETVEAARQCRAAYEALPPSYRIILRPEGLSSVLRQHFSGKDVSQNVAMRITLGIE